MYTILYFSPTGNTRFLANHLKKSFLDDESEIKSLEKTIPSELEASDHLILMFPIHGFNPPRTVSRFVKEIPSNLYKSVSLIAVGCNTIWVNEGASMKLKKLFTKKGYEIVADEVLAMPLTLVMSFPEETVKKLYEESITKIEEISKKIIKGISTNKKVPITSKMISFVGKIESPAAKLFGLELHANKTCTSCSICWNNCPENNIKQGKNNKPKFGLNCSMCMRCIYDCPTKSISPYISKFIAIKDGYKVLE